MSECSSVVKCPSCNITCNSVHKYVIKDVTIYIAIYACQNLCVTVGITRNVILLSWLLDVEYQESMQGNVADISMDTADGVEAEPSHFPLRAAEGAAVPIFTHDSPLGSPVLFVIFCQLPSELLVSCVTMWPFWHSLFNLPTVSEVLVILVATWPGHAFGAHLPGNVVHVVALVAAVRRLSRQLLFADLLPAGMTRDAERSIWQLCRNGFRLDIYRSSKVKIKEETPKTQRHIQTNIIKHLFSSRKSFSHHVSGCCCGQAVPGWVGEVGTAAAAAGPIPGRARGGGRPGAGHQAPEATTAAGPCWAPEDPKGFQGCWVGFRCFYFTRFTSTSNVFPGLAPWLGRLV